MKYIRMEISEPLADLKLKKVLLTVAGENGETPWVKTLSDGRQVLQNHALNFYPFPSWGMVLPAGDTIDLREYFEKEEISLHPEAYDKLTEAGTIDKDGLYVEKNEPEKQV